MLFDLRSRGRRRTVQVIYLGLAVLMLSGLVLFGVGAGNGIGGLLNAFTNNGSGSSQGSAISQQTKAALKATRKNPTSAAAWASLVQVRWSAAESTANSATGTFTSAGKKQLALLAQDWQHYTTLTKSPDIDVATLAAEAYGALGQFANEGNAWEVVVQDQPQAAKGYECLAASAYAAKQTRKANLAAAKAESLVPKLEKLQLKQVLTEAKTNSSVAAQC